MTTMMFCTTSTPYYRSTALELDLKHTARDATAVMYPTCIILQSLLTMCTLRAFFIRNLCRAHHPFSRYITSLLPYHRHKTRDRRRADRPTTMKGLPHRPSAKSTLPAAPDSGTCSPGPKETRPRAPLPRRNLAARSRRKVPQTTTTTKSGKNELLVLRTYRRSLSGTRCLV